MNELVFFISSMIDWGVAAGSGAGLYEWQRDYLRRDHTRYAILLKSRQIGASFAIALEAVAKALLYNQSTLIQSISMRESKTKIRYCAQILDALSIEPPIESQTTESFGFGNGARIVSLPGAPNASRGFAGYNIVLDELAFISNSEEVFSSILPVLTHGGTLTAASTPFSQEGAFYQKWSENNNFWRLRVPWYQCEGLTVSRKQFASNPGIDAANYSIREARQGLTLAQFQREYNCSFTDEGVSIFTLEHIDAITSNHIQYIEQEQLWKSEATLVGQELIFGYDVGVVGHPSVVIMLDVSREPAEVRGCLTMRGIDHMDQVRIVSELVDRYSALGVLVDKTGPGAAISQELCKNFPMIADGLAFTLKSKEQLVKTGIRAVQNKTVRIPADRLWKAQMHSLHEDITDTGNIRYVTPAQKTGHSDRLWALLMALDAKSRLAY